MSWEKTYSVGVPEFDAQHQHLFDLLNRFHDAMSTGHGNETMSNILHELIAYTKTHFQAEERLLQSKHYPDLAAHKAEHDKLTHQVIKFQEDFAAGRTSVNIQLMNFLRDWLSNHILHTDKRYGAYLEKNV